MINDLIIFILFIVLLLILAFPLGRYMEKVFSDKKTFFDILLKPVEKMIYKITGIKNEEEMNWKKYLISLVIFNLGGVILLYLIQILQGSLPLNPMSIPGVESWHLAFNTAISFVTNTNWQSYSGEITMSYFTQLAGLTVQNFLSAGTGIVVAVALIRGLTRKNTDNIGNFFVDLVRSVLWILLPLAIFITLLVVQQGVVQTIAPAITVQTLSGSEQTIAMGPVATQEAIKMLGTNGGGFFNVNSAHPFENPTPLTNLVQCFSILLIPTALVFMFGLMSRDKRQGFALISTMVILFVIMFGISYTSETYGNSIINNMSISGPTAMEGKEVRFGVGESVLFSTTTTAASCGAVNSMHDSYTPLGGLVTMLQMMIGEVVFGGVGAGFYGIIIFVIMTVFIVGLMVGRTPEYLGKKIDVYEMKMATIAILIPAITVLLFSSIAVTTNLGLGSLNNSGPHGLSEILYAFSSATNNNGSAFAGISANNVFYNVLLGIAMLLGRFGVIIPIIAIAGSMANKKISPQSAGTFSTTGTLFVILLSGVILIIGALTFLPALSLGPIVEHLLMLEGTTF